MFNTKDELIENLNCRIYEIRMNNLMGLLKKYRENKHLLEDIINTAYAMDMDFSCDRWRKEIKSRLDMKDLSKKALTDRFDCSGDPVVSILNKYISIDKKVKDIENLYRQLNLHEALENELTIRRHFTFNLNKVGYIQAINPTFSGLSKEEMQLITGFWEAKEFSSTEEILNYLDKYKNCLREGYSSNFLIKGTVLYITVYPSEKSIGDRI